VYMSFCVNLDFPVSTLPSPILTDWNDLGSASIVQDAEVAPSSQRAIMRGLCNSDERKQLQEPTAHVPLTVAWNSCPEKFSEHPDGTESWGHLL
jgi:hypothetical protein